MTAVRTRAEALRADTLARFKALTPVRVAGEVIVIAAAILLDLVPGPWADEKATGWTLGLWIAAYLVLLPV
ncbi:MAG TPA: hypothetical protein VF821_11180, partial [Lentzea sp.]